MDSCFDDHRIHLSNGHLRPQDTTLSFPLFSFSRLVPIVAGRGRSRENAVTGFSTSHSAQFPSPELCIALSPSCHIAKTHLVHLTFGVDPVTGGTREVNEAAYFG